MNRFQQKRNMSSRNPLKFQKLYQRKISQKYNLQRYLTNHYQQPRLLTKKLVLLLLSQRKREKSIKNLKIFVKNIKSEESGLLMNLKKENFESPKNKVLKNLNPHKFMKS